MRFVSTLLSLSLAAASPAALAQVNVRTVRFASILTNTVVNEVVIDDRFFFEKCDFNHQQGADVLEELNQQRFSDCNALGLSQPLSARDRVLRELDEKFAERRRALGDPSVLKWAANGALQGGLIGGIGAVVINRMFPRFIRRWTNLEDPARVFATFGGFSAVVTSWTAAHRAIQRQGRYNPTLELLDPRMPSTLYLLDQRTNEKGAQLRAMDNITDVITRTMVDFVP